MGPLAQYILGVGIVAVAVEAGVTAWQLWLLRRGWEEYMRFLEPPDTSETILRRALTDPKSSEERAREVEGRVPGLPRAALEETDMRRAWWTDGEEEVP